MHYIGTFPASRVKFGRRISLETHDLDRVRLTGRLEMGRWAFLSRSPQADEETIEFGFFQAWLRRSMVAPSNATQRLQTTSAYNRSKKKAPATHGHQGRSVLDAPSTWLSLIGLLPSRARLRFTRQGDYGSARPPADSAPQNRPNALTGFATQKFKTQACNDAPKDDTNRTSRTIRENVRNGIETSVHLPNLTRPSLA